MNFLTSALVMVLLTATLCVSEEIPLKCPDTARRELKDISNIFNCTNYFLPEKELAICQGGAGDPVRTTVTFVFKILMEVPEGTDICLGLQIFYVDVTERNDSVVTYRADFNASLAVGILTPDHNPSKTNRSCSIRLLSDVLNLKILSDFSVSDSSFWNFSSPLLGMKLNWFQGFQVNDFHDRIRLIWLEGLQNTSIQVLKVAGITNSVLYTFLLRDMPFLREVNLQKPTVSKFHPDSFLGMGEMEVLVLKDAHVPSIPERIDRMPKLKALHIVAGEIQPIDFQIPKKALSKLKDLESLTLDRNWIFNLTGRIPPFSNLRVLSLYGCRLSTVEESDFEGFPLLQMLSLAGNMLTHLKENTFRPLKQLKLLVLHSNSLTEWPVLHNFSFKVLDMSRNLLSDVYNLGNTNTTVEILNISNNRIFGWDDKYVFSLNKSLIPSDDQQNKLSMSHTEDTNNIILTSGSTKTNSFLKILGLSATQREELSIPLHSGSQKKLFRRIRENLSLVNFYDHTELSKSDNGEKIIVRNFESSLWVNTVIISSNKISDLSENMMQSLEGIHEIDLGGNEFKCVDCRMIPFQKWLNTTSTIVSNLGTSDPLLCVYPTNQRGTPVNLVQYDEEPCLEKIRTTSLLTLIGVPVGVMSVLFAAAAGGIYKCRLAIIYMLHLYKIRRRAQAFSRSAFNKYAFDAFICYSSQDRRFVLSKLVPFLEKGQERYCLCLHERDFPLGSRIVDNIVGSIQHSRKTIVVLSEYFIKSKWCKWELEMANHKMFHEDEYFLILIQLEKMARNKLPRHLRLFMDTGTLLEWPTAEHNDEEKLVLGQLKNALGPSIFQTTNERAPLLQEILEEY